MSLNLKDIEDRMESSVQAAKKEMSGLRTGRASVNMLDTVQVEVYGSMMPISQVGSLSVPEPRMLTVQVWDEGNVKAVEKGIANAGLGLNPMSEGQVIRVTVPELTEERRKDLVKVAGKYAEQGRISVRNVRRDAMDQVKKLKGSGDISEDEQKAYESDIQELTDKYVAQIDEIIKEKEQEIMTV